ncbi:hypothetical protein PV327_008918 [Microctonus hyperodae]|uniref:Uncharacterized protein n=1 Tax=Microctonus hyperodae TaxID=165561 RepID=A0AA39FTB2_MICHY|nr:hypothetical protein PV327_008918 [Microctonus hyperodae]
MAQALSPNIDPLEYREHLKWTKNSLNQFEAFFNGNPNRVFFRNKPRSLLSPGPHVLITPEAQCRCLGYDYYKKRRSSSAIKVNRNECLKPLQCKREGKVQFFSAPIWPLDGLSVIDGKKTSSSGNLNYTVMLQIFFDVNIKKKLWILRIKITSENTSFQSDTK